MSTVEILVWTLAIFFGLFIVYWLHEVIERRTMARTQQAFDAAYGLGFFHGWVSRHKGDNLDECRPSLDTLRKVAPSLLDKETPLWLHEFDHMTFEEFRKMQLAMLNSQMKADGLSNSPRTPIPGIE